jgi:hypothetical protein
MEVSEREGKANELSEDTSVTAAILGDCAVGGLLLGFELVI